ncbi:MAG: hypothetical protein K2X81_12035 [Candidatus Obscuribacterales bacterium]|nr:hypothetical protein [Candidatus Obscuribacterales bacterium]
MSDSIQEPKPTCFVLMPIADTAGYESGHFGRVYEHLMKPAILAAGFNPVRADDAVKTDYIVVGIIQKIVESEMVVCDFSSRNANVLYELGVRHAFNKPVVLLKDRRTEKIFDIQGLRYTEYDESLRIDAVNKDIVKITAAIVETSKSSDKDMNSIVQLAGIRTAELPAGQTISPDTELLLSSLNAIDRRLQALGEHESHSSVNFVVEKDKVIFSDGSDSKIGTLMFARGEPIGTLLSLNPRKQTIVMQPKGGGSPIEIQANSPAAKGLSDIPF